HIALEAYLPAANTFALIDPDFGAVVRDRHTGELVSVATAAKFLRDEPDRLQVEDIGNKEWLKPKYNVDEPTPDFAWTPRTMSGRGTTRFWPSLAPGDYKEILTLYTASYSIFDDPLGQGPPRRFARDGSPHHSQ
ncbi:MAG TPA: hypothetical protein VLM40_10830, partial [Gemmata sp.]|nr:hypothetical protein [Gemmata sp.]